MKNMSDSQKENKNKAISDSIKATRLKRKGQTCKIFELKIQYNKLSERQKETLEMLFVEAKWLYNDILSSGDPFNYKISNEVTVLNKDKEAETRSLNYLGSQMKQSVHTQLIQNIKNLSAKKKTGAKVGKLKFISDFKSIDLKQYGTTYRFDFLSERVKVQKVPGYLRVKGLSQVIDYDLANAKLVKKPSGFFLKVTAFIDKADTKDYFMPNTFIGIDFGLKNHLTLSNGEKFNSTVGETERLRRLKKKLSRQQRGSNNYRKTKVLIQAEYEKITNKKNDISNKLAAEILKNEHVFIQNEQLSSWKKRDGYVRGGRVIQHSILGRVKAKLINHDRVTVLRKNKATTQTCPICTIKTKHMPGIDLFRCSDCGYSADRDIHAAMNMILMSIPTEHRNFKPLELTSDFKANLDLFKALSCERGSV